MVSQDLRQRKQALRRDLQVVRATACVNQPAAPQQLHDQLLLEAGIFTGVTAFYQAFGSELSVTPLIDSLAASGHLLALPIIVGRGQPLDFRLYRPGDALLENSMGILEPARTAPLARPAVLLVPLLAFDVTGRRLGYGGGYYDRTLKLLRASGPVTAIGVGFACQQIDKVPAGLNDEKLDRVVTEQGPVKLVRP